VLFYAAFYHFYAIIVLREVQQVNARAEDKWKSVL